MAARGSAHRKVPGSPLAGVLRESVRNNRRSTRAVAVAALDPVAAIRTVTATAAATAVTDATGYVNWSFPIPFKAVPVVVATAESSVASLCTIVAVSPDGVRVRVRQPDSTYRFVPATGVVVHLVAYL